jgi:hypothetical protein
MNFRYKKCKEFYDECSKCGQEIIGRTEKNCHANMQFHKYFKHGIEIQTEKKNENQSDKRD